MKVKATSLFNTILIIIVLHYNFQQVYGQEKVNITTGFGLLELLNIGIKYQSNQTQVGLSVGSIPVGSEEKIISISSDIYYHFGGFSELTNVRPWYGRMGVNFLRDETASIIDKRVFLNMRVGRHFNISKKVGIQFDLGVAFQLHHEEIRKKPSINIDFELLFIPSLGIGLFYRI